jgi:hypothetical protein
MSPTSPALPSLLSYLPSEVLVHDLAGVFHVFPATGLTLPIYFALKGKHGYQLENREKLVFDIQRIVAIQASQHDYVVFPQSRFPFLREVTSGLANCVELRKRSKLEVCQRAQESAKWGREARVSQELAWAEMGETFIINKIKSNQRKHYVPYLFEPMSLPETANVLLLDDFIMSGNTLSAMRAAIGASNVIALGIFYQLDSAEKLKQVLPST